MLTSKTAHTHTDLELSDEALDQAQGGVLLLLLAAGCKALSDWNNAVDSTSPTGTLSCSNPTNKDTKLCSE